MSIPDAVLAIAAVIAFLLFLAWLGGLWLSKDDD